MSGRWTGPGARRGKATARRTRLMGTPTADSALYEASKSGLRLAASLWVRMGSCSCTSGTPRPASSLSTASYAGTSAATASARLNGASASAGLARPTSVFGPAGAAAASLACTVHPSDLCTAAAHAHAALGQSKQ